MTRYRKGLYAAILELSEQYRATIGKLGTYTFKSGFYIYVGSGSGRGSTSVEGRLKRHTSKDKRMFWHIDHFTANSQIEIKVAISAFTDEVSECTLILQLINALNAKLALRGFGSSDCRCEGHLIYVTPVGLGSDIKDLIDRVYATFSELGLQPTFHEKTK